MSTRLFATYVSLVRDFPGNCEGLFGCPLGDENSVWLSVDERSFPCLLFPARKGDLRGDIELRSLSVRFSRNCEVYGTTLECATGNYTIVQFNEDDPDVIRILLRLLEETFPGFNRLYTNKEIASRITKIADVFRKVDESPGDIIGLWGELYVLSRSKNLSDAVNHWCSHSKAKYDFITSGFALEVKTTVLPRRKHRFGLDQLRPVDGFRVYVASLITVEVNSGKTISDFIDDIYNKLVDKDMRAFFLAQCIEKAGQGIYRSDLRLSVLSEHTSFSIFDAIDIPAPQVHHSLPVENVRFDVDLSGVTPIPKSQIEAILSFS